MGAPPTDSRFGPTRGQNRSVTSAGCLRIGAIRESLRPRLRLVFFGFRKAPIAVVDGSFYAPRHKLRKRFDVRIDAGTVQCFKVEDAILDSDDCP